MIKREIYCYEDYVNVEGIYNNLIYYYAGGGWASLSLATCINCGELFVFDKEDLRLNQLSVKQIVVGKNCPMCKIELNSSIVSYPDTFRTNRGIIGHIKEIPHILSDKERKLIEVWDLTTL